MLISELFPHCVADQIGTSRFDATIIDFGCQYRPSLAQIGRLARWRRCSEVGKILQHPSARREWPRIWILHDSDSLVDARAHGSLT